MSDFELGARLRAVRQMQGLSQRELAKRAGVSNAIISLIEQNRTSPSVGLLKKVLAGVPMSLADFFIGELTPPSIDEPPVTLPEKSATVKTASPWLERCARVEREHSFCRAAAYS